MAIKAIAHSYWRSIKRSVRTFESIEDNIKVSKDDPAYANEKQKWTDIMNDVRTLARADVENGVITAEEYKQYIGEEYVAPATKE